MKITFGNNKKIIGVTPETTFKLNVEEMPVGGSESVESNTFSDANYDLITLSNPIPNFNVNVVQPLDLPNPSFESLDQNIATVDQNGYVSYVNNGRSQIKVVAYGTQKKILKKDIAAAGTSYNFQPTSYVLNSLSKHLIDQILAAINGKTANDTSQIFLTANNADSDSPAVTRNSSLFLNNDFSAMSVIRSDQPNERYPLALVTARHALIAAHVKPSQGVKVIWKRSDNTYQTAVVSAVEVVYDGTTALDLAVVYLDRDVTGITPFDVLPQDWHTTYCPSVVIAELQANVNANIGSTHGSLPIIRKSMHDKNGVLKSWLCINRAVSFNAFLGGMNIEFDDTYFSEVTPLADWYSRGEPGDSGGCIFFLINNNLVFIGSVWTAGGCVNAAHYFTEIETIMNNLANVAQGTYTLNTVDLTGFTTF